MMEKTDETIPSREELAVFIEEAAVSVTNNYEEAPAVLMVDDDSGQVRSWPPAFTDFLFLRMLVRQ